MEEIERYLFARTLQATGGNQSKAAEMLGITRGKVRDRIAYFGIQLDPRRILQRIDTRLFGPFCLSMSCILTVRLEFSE